jgi:hypothetical protein
MNDERALTVTGWKRQFLQVLKRLPNVKSACEAAGIDRREAYRARERDELFAELWDSAIAESVDKLEEKAFALAEQGDTGLLMFLLKSHKPDVYRDTQRHEVGLLGGIVYIPEKKHGEE